MTDQKRNQKKENINPLGIAITSAIVGAGLAVAGVVALKDEKNRKKVKKVIGDLKTQALEYKNDIEKKIKENKSKAVKKVPEEIKNVKKITNSATKSVKKDTKTAKKTLEK